MTDTYNSSPIPQKYSNITRYSDDESKDDSKLDIMMSEQKIASNNRVMRVLYIAIEHLSQKRFEEAIESFTSCLYLFESQAENSNTHGYQISLVYCSMAVCYFNVNKFEDCENNLNAASNTLDLGKNIQIEKYRLLYLKILSNYLVLYIMTKEYGNVSQIKELLEKFIKSEPDSLKRANYTLSVIYMLFNADSLQDYNVEGDEYSYGKLSPQGFGVRIMVSAINYEIAGQREKATQALFQALEHWQSLDDHLMSLLTLKYQLHLNQDNKITYDKLAKYYRELASSFNYDKNTLERTFDEFETKLNIVKDLSFMFMDLEKINSEQIYKLKEQNDAELTKLAVRLSLKHNMSSIKTLLKEGREPAHREKELRDSLFFIEKTLKLVEGENPQSMINQMSSHSFVSKEISHIKAAVAAIDKSCHINWLRDSFMLVKQAPRRQTEIKKTYIPLQTANLKKKPTGARNNQQPETRQQNGNRVDMSMSESIINPLGVLTEKAKDVITRGEYLLKLHVTTNGHAKNFIKVFGGTTIRWAGKAEHVTNLRDCHSYLFSDMRGIIYGKATNTFLKSSNKKLEPWLCFSLILKRRSLDIYCTEDQIDNWYLGLSQLIKLHRPSTYALSKGQYYWRKLNYLLKYLVMSKISDKQRKKMRKGLSFCKAIIMYDTIMESKLPDNTL